MKNASFLLLLTFVTVAQSSIAKSPKIYPQILSYFKNLDKQAQRSDNLSALETLKYNFNQTSQDSVVLVCSGNSFRSQALQVFLETKLAEQKKRKIEVFSCGYKTVDIDERLVVILKKIGYKIEEKQLNGQKAYSARYSDVYPPILLYAKNCSDNTLPAKPFISILACQEASGSCEKLTYSDIKINLTYKDRNELEGQAYEDEVNQMATDINYIFRN